MKRTFLWVLRARSALLRGGCAVFGHRPGEPEVLLVEDVTLLSPDGAAEPVTLRIVKVECLRCGRTLALRSAGIVCCGTKVKRVRP